MPKKSHHQAIGRLLEILKRLPTRGAGISARELTDWLTDEGFEVSKRTVERDLSALAVHFQLVYNDKSVPYGWRWMRDAVAGFPALTVADAMSLHLVEDLLAPLLPAALLDSLRPRFRQARKKRPSAAFFVWLPPISDGLLQRWRYVIRPLVRSYGVISTFTRSPVRMRM
mgnify:CR=1 FL=1